MPRAVHGNSVAPMANVDVVVLNRQMFVQTGDAGVLGADIDGDTVAVTLSAAAAAIMNGVAANGDISANRGFVPMRFGTDVNGSARQALEGVVFNDGVMRFDQTATRAMVFPSTIVSPLHAQREIRCHPHP